MHLILTTDTSFSDAAIHASPDRFGGECDGLRAELLLTDHLATIVY